MNEEIFDRKKIKTFSNCKDLVKSMVGTRDGVIFYNEKFRLDLENTCYKASVCEELQQENQQLKEKYDKLRDFIIDYGSWNGDELILEKIRTLEENNEK